ncbi:zinc finger protein RFP-like [Ahaetulla prasina]|uniref:zinc finger protein RFP-like n=1 Tax=Ahaetulla prasina TaxID=499056 RepID=UPI002647E8EB|nr:zinc finger protein RFP-like [Ahaetulla prasina]
MVEVARRCGGPWGEEGGSFCPKHREPLKLFCRDHETLISVVCDRSKEHKGHSVIPLQEAFQEYQIGFSQEESLQGAIQILGLPAWCRTISQNQTGEKIQGAFIEVLHSCSSSFLLLFPLRENVILDPDPAHPDRLDISEDRKSVKGLNPVKKINDVANCKRFEYNPYVLGCQEFSTGRHFWEVIIGDRAGWGVGVASKALNLRNFDVQTRHWQIGEWEGKYMAISPSERFDLVLTERPTRVCICLNCEEGQVNFFDARTAALLHTFSEASLVGETLLPCFFLHDGVWLALP